MVGRVRTGLLCEAPMILEVHILILRWRADGWCPLGHYQPTGSADKGHACQILYPASPLREILRRARKYIRRSGGLLPTGPM
jgi:hypothetical protein